MGTTLTGTTPQDTYESLIKVADNGPLSATLKLLSDGLGNDSALALSTSVTAIRGGQQLRLFRTDNAIYGSIQYLTGAGGFKFDDANGDGFTFAQGADTRLAISATGNVGIGTSAPTEKLHVSSGNIIVDSTQAIGFGDRSSQIVGNTGAFGFLRFDTNNAERVRITESGVLSLTQGQIKFPATQVASADANTLDDYEEGTWTPSLGGDTTYLAQSGSYTKIGRVVNFKAVVYVNLIGTGSTTAIGGLPFSAAAGGGAVCAAPHYSGIATLISSANGNVNSTTITMSSNVAASATNQTLNAFFQNTTYLEIAGTYNV